MPHKKTFAFYMMDAPFDVEIDPGRCAAHLTLRQGEVLAAPDLLARHAE